MGGGGRAKSLSLWGYGEGEIVSTLGTQSFRDLFLGMGGGPKIASVWGVLGISVPKSKLFWGLMGPTLLVI